VAALFWVTPAVLLFIASSCYSVQVDQARVVVRWAPSASSEVRDAVAAATGLVYRRSIERDGVNDTDSFLFIDPGDEALSALRSHPAVQSADIDDGAAVSTPRVSLGKVPAHAWLIEWQVQSTVLLLAALLLLAGSIAARRAVRIVTAVACTIGLGAAAVSLPIDPRVHMGDSQQYTSSRPGFINVFPHDAVGFEAHLSSRLVWWLDQRFGANEGSPAAALAILSRAATCWFAAMLLGAAMLDRFSPTALRYLALAVAAPASLMYFGYLELGYLSLTPVAFPLILQGIRGLRGRLEAGALLAGFGAALHGFGVMSIAGAGAAAVSARARAGDRAWLVGRTAAFATTAFLVWIPIYVVGMGLMINPSDAGEIPWRHLTETAIQGTYVNWAVLSLRGGIEILTACLMVGVPLAIAAAAAVRVDGDVARAALAFSVPSIVFLCVFWPIQGLAVEADLLVAAFPAVYALSWLAAQSARATVLGLLLLSSSHIVFWRVLFSDAFVASRL
jgi:hypothetical protein